MRSVLLFFCLCICSLTLLKAQDIRFRLVVSAEEIGIQDFLQVRYQLEGATEKPDFPLPTFPGFIILEGPDVQSGWTEQGDIRRYMGVTYLLKPSKAGRLLIPAVSLHYNGSIHTSNAQVITVRRPEENSSPEVSLLLKPGESLTDRVNKDLFVRLEVNKASCYIGEPVVATYLLYTRLRSESRIVKRPSFNGFGVYDMEVPEAGVERRETINGKQFSVYVLRKVQLYPLQAGEQQLDPMDVEHEVTFIREDKVGGPIGLTNALRKLADGEASDAVVKHVQTTSHAPVRIQVKALPALADSMFSGAVGSFTMDVQLAEKGTLYAEDPMNLVIRIAGKGNFPVMAPPLIRWPAGVEAFDPVVKEHYLRFISPISGAKIFTIPFVCAHAGRFILPPVQFRFFDPETRSYRLLTSGNIPLVVKASRNGSSEKQSGDRQQEEKHFSVEAGLIILLVLISILVIFLFRRKRAVPAFVEREQQIAVQPVQTFVSMNREAVDVLLEAGDDREVYRRLDADIQHWLHVKLGHEPGQDWVQDLRIKGMDAEKTDQLAAIRERAARVLYTPWSGKETMREDVRDVQRLLGE